MSCPISLAKSGTLESGYFLFGFRGVASYQQQPCDTFYTIFLPCAVLHPNAFTSHTCLWGAGWACRGWCGLLGLLPSLSVQQCQDAALGTCSIHLCLRELSAAAARQNSSPRRAWGNTAGAQSPKLWFSVFLALWNKWCWKTWFYLQWLVLIKISLRKKQIEK